MDYNITLTVGGETWSAYRKAGSLPGVNSKKDKNYLTRVVAALNDSLEIAKMQLSKEGGDTHNIAKYPQVNSHNF